MNEPDLAYQDLQHIRSIMARTARLVTFSGYSAIAIGVLWLAALLIGADGLDERLAEAAPGTSALFGLLRGATMGLVGLFVASLVIGVVATYREATAKGESLLTAASLRIGFAIGVHLVAGAALGLAAAQYSLVLAASLIPVLYGLLLLNLARYSRHDIQPLGLAAIAAGLWACFTGQVWLGLLLAFGVAHLAYGIWVEISKRSRHA